MQRGRAGDQGVSEVVGEMLMIALVIILISAFAAALYNYLPVNREPTVSIMMTNDTRGNVTLWHKGGDWVSAEDLAVVIGNGESSRRIPWNSGNFSLVPDKKVFDLGSNITVRLPGSLAGNESIRLVTPRTVIFTGRIGP